MTNFLKMTFHTITMETRLLKIKTDQLLDSRVFAEEVEPTGAVPMELSLERYRNAALPNKYQDPSGEPRLRPRMSPHLFPGTQILSQDKSHYQRILNTWFGQPTQTWKLIYRASSHGYSASAFHRHCDGICPAFVIILVSGYILYERIVKKIR